MAHLDPASRQSRRRRWTAVVILLSLQALVHGSAGAHGGAAVFDVETDVSGMDVALDVGITYETDGEPADGAIVQATGTGPGGERIELPLERDGDGRYVASTTVPEDGSWRFTIESSFPPGSTTVEVDVGGSGSNAAANRWAVLAAAAVAVGIATWLLQRRRRRT